MNNSPKRKNGSARRKLKEFINTSTEKYSLNIGKEVQQKQM